MLGSLTVSKHQMERSCALLKVLILDACTNAVSCVPTLNSHYIFRPPGPDTSVPRVLCRSDGTRAEEHCERPDEMGTLAFSRFHRTAHVQGTPLAVATKYRRNTSIVHSFRACEMGNDSIQLLRSTPYPCTAANRLCAYFGLGPACRSVVEPRHKGSTTHAPGKVGERWTGFLIGYSPGSWQA